MAEKPLVSVIIPAFNSAAWLPQTLRSVRSQTHQNLEVIVVDDGSLDNSAEIAREFGSKVLVQKNSGASCARNAGMETARGDYVQYLDADDELSPEKIAVQVEALEQAGPGWVAACPFTNFFDGDDPGTSALHDADWITGKTFTPEAWISKLLGFNGEPWRIVANGCYLVPRRVARETGPWMPERSPDDDGEYFLRIVLNSRGVIGTGGRFYYRKFRRARSFSGRVNEQWCAGVFASISRKYETLRQWNAEKARQFAAREFGALASVAYPEFDAIYRASIVRAQECGGKALPVFATAEGRAIAKLLGWKTAKRLQVLKRRLLVRSA
jgi:glycosyltransferase involved in cell wall biosynthesis